MAVNDPTGGAQVTIRCPACERLFQPLPPLRGDTRTCFSCGHEVALTELVRGPRDGIWGVRPAPPSGAWEGSFLAIYPDGTRSDFDLSGSRLRPDQTVPGKPGFVLDRWDVTDVPVEGGHFGVVGILRNAP